MNELLGALLVPVLAAVAVAVLTPIVRSVAISRGQIAESRPDRWHKRPVPAVGGVAIVAGFALAAAVLVGLVHPDLARGEVASRAVIPVTPPLALLVAAAMAAGLGFVDDLVQLRPMTKLVGQVAAAAILIVSGIGVWLTGNYVVDVLISGFWFVGITNALNLLDNMDGLAGGIAMIAGAFMGVGFLLDGQADLAVLAFAFSAALAGFLVHNYPPARIFMGDSGSLFLGIFLAGLALSPAPGGARSLFVVVALPLVVLAVPIMDTTFVTFTRMVEGRSIAEGGRDHTSHSLVALGLSEKRALWILWALAVGGGVLGLLLRTADRSFAYPLGGVLVVGLGIISAYLFTERMKKERPEIARQRPPLQRGIMALHARIPVLVLALDGILVAAAYYAAYLIRWDEPRLPQELLYFQSTVVVVIAVKLVAFAAAGAYASRWRHFAAMDALAVLRANLLATVLTAAALLLFQRVGLSRGVLIVDFFVCAVLTVGVRASFRLMEGARDRWSEEGLRVALLGSLVDAELAFRSLPRLGGPRLRMVAIVDPELDRVRAGKVHGSTVYGGVGGLRRAVEELKLSAVLLVNDGGAPAEDLLEEYLLEGAGLDIYRLRIELDAPGDATEA